MFFGTVIMSVVGEKFLSMTVQNKHESQMDVMWGVYSNKCLSNLFFMIPYVCFTYFLKQTFSNLLKWKWKIIPKMGFVSSLTCNNSGPWPVSLPCVCRLQIQSNWRWKWLTYTSVMTYCIFNMVCLMFTHPIRATVTETFEKIQIQHCLYILHIPR